MKKANSTIRKRATVLQAMSVSSILVLAVAVVKSDNRIACFLTNLNFLYNSPHKKNVLWLFPLQHESISIHRLGMHFSFARHFPSCPA